MLVLTIFLAYIRRYKGQTGRAPALYLNRTDTLKANRLQGREPKLTVQMVTNVMSLSEDDESKPVVPHASANEKPAYKLKPKPWAANRNAADVKQKTVAEVLRHNNPAAGKKSPHVSPKAPHLLEVAAQGSAATSDSASSGNEGSPITVRKKAVPPRRGTLKVGIHMTFIFY